MKTYHILSNLDVSQFGNADGILHFVVAFIGEPNLLKKIAIFLEDFFNFARERVVLQAVECQSKK